MSYEDKHTSHINLIEDGELAFSDVFNFLWRNKFWITISVILALTCAHLYLTTQNNTYERTSYIKLNTGDKSSGSKLSMFAGIDLGGDKALDDEVFILQSPSLMKKVVEELGLNTRYYHYVNPFTKGDFMRNIFTFEQIEYYDNSPFSLTLTPDPMYPKSMHPKSIRLEFKHEGDSTFAIRELAVNGVPKTLESMIGIYGRPIILEGISLTLSLDYKDDIIIGDKYAATWNEAFTSARNFLGGLSVTVQGTKANRTDIVALTYKDTSPARAADIINTLFEVANKVDRDYKNKSSEDILAFIDGRLADIVEQLSEAEQDYKNYQSKRALVNSNSQTNLTLSSDRQYQDELTEILLQQEVLRMVYDFMIETPEGTFRVIPSYIVVSDAGLNSMISKYNDKVVSRDRMIFNSSEVNPKVLSLNTELNASKKGIELSLENLLKVYSLRQRELEKVLDKSKGKIADIPEQQLQMQHLSRKVEIIEPLYRMLQQKKEETQIAMYAAEDIFRLIEPAFGNNSPVAPNRKMVYLLAFILGFALTPGTSLARMYLRGKVETKDDVENAIDAPVLAVLPRSGQKDYVLIPRTGRDHLCESFRMLRSNIQSLPEDVRVFQVTSSVLGEGKSFVASNLALSLAYVGKKVLLMGMDLRKPVLPKIFKCEIDSKKALVNYLAGREKNLDEIIVKSKQSNNLDLLFSGVIPPDPTVLLSNDRAENLIAELKERYDYVIIDSAPYFPVTDSSIINKYVDATLYIVRCDYTSLKILKEIDSVIHRKINPIRNAHIIMNDFNMTAIKYRYGYGSGYNFDHMSSYGYSYGSRYGYGYGYGNEHGNNSTINGSELEDD
ncbi:MAG: polysaccharide biosynthesis tyrosine autokinase [Bacteroidales bacterium]|nr:polysaccharide biosynthesis tyrosine autokinase [Bacteroidales bacterium]